MNANEVNRVMKNVLKNSAAASLHIHKGQVNRAPPQLSSWIHILRKSQVEPRDFSRHFFTYIPVVPHNAVAEVSKIGNL